MKSIFIKIFLNLLLFITIVFSQMSKRSSSVVWDDIKRISFDSATSIVPKIVASGDTVHLIWFGMFDKAQPDSGGGVQYSRSTDGGVTFSPQKNLIPDDSSGARRYLTISGRYVYLIYEALTHPNPSPYWEAAIIRSTDAGLTWSKGKVIGDYTPWAAVAKDSNIYVYAGFVENNIYRNAMLISHDYGVTWDTMRIPMPRGPWTAQITVTKNALHLIRTIGLTQYYEIFYNRSTDFGYTWSVNDTLSTNDGQTGQNPKFTSDKNNLYVVWNDQKYGGNFSGTIFLRRSTDEGITWQPEQIISQLNSAVFTDVTSVNNLSAVIWDNEYDSLGAIRIRVSQDGAKKFLPFEKISPDEYHGGDPAVRISGNTIHTAWWNQNSWEIYYRRGQFYPTSVKYENIVPDDYSLLQNYPNPFNPITSIEYFIPKYAHVRLKVYDILGKELITLVNTYQQAGKYSVSLNAINFSSGIYYYNLTSGSFTEVKKMILLK